MLEHPRPATVGACQSWTVHAQPPRQPGAQPLPGTRGLARLEENLRTAAVEFTADDLRDIERVPSNITIRGARYPKYLKRMTATESVSPARAD
jgi:aryl-alcohol dehydrogenase-like predicted oxidoreductase